MKKFIAPLFIIISLILNILAGGVIFYFFQPILRWYWNYRPLIGVDFYSFASFVGYLARHFVWQINGWKYVWWTGAPLYLDYPTLHAYLTLPLLKYFTMPVAIQVYMLGSTFLYLFFSYLLFAQLAKDKVLAVVLTLGALFSTGLYGALVWGGSLNYYATQFFLPLVLWFLVIYFQSNDKRWFYASAFFLGISFLGHPLVAFSNIIPISLVLLLFYPLKGEKYFSLARIGRLFIYYGFSILAGIFGLRLSLGNTPLAIILRVPQFILDELTAMMQTKTTSSVTHAVVSASQVKTQSAIANFNYNQLQRFFTDINPLFYILLGCSFILLSISFILHKKKRGTFAGIVYILPIIWVFASSWLYAKGYPISNGGWYRAFWPVPIVLGIFICYSWGDFLKAIKERFPLFEKNLILWMAMILVSAGLFLLVGFLFIQPDAASKVIAKLETPGYRQQSSAFPDSLNYYIENPQYADLPKSLVPSWLDPNDTQYRLYDADQRINIWWSSLFDMPLVKGYIEVSPGDATGVFYWASIALTQSGGVKDGSLVKTWGYPVDMAYNNALFLIDWLSIKYIEAEHEKSDSFNPLVDYIAKSKILEKKAKVTVPGWVQLYQIPDGQPLIWHPKDEEYLTYYKVNDAYVSPILQTTNAPVVGIIGGDDNYQTIIRDLAGVNLNSRNIIPIKLGKYIDDVSADELSDMDAVILYGYDYRSHNSVWSKLENYVQKGGKVLVETGSDVKQTDSIDLPGDYPKEMPSIFPINMTKKGAMGTQWQLTDNGMKETGDVDITNFGPPILDNQPWSFSLPTGSNSLRDGAQVILSNNNLPLIVSWKMGEGQVIWSGMNLPYHITTQKNMEEAKLLKNLLNDFVDTTRVEYADVNTQRNSANEVVLKGTKAKGVIFRENGYPTWTAILQSDTLNTNLHIYQTGPVYYGFSYVRLPNNTGQNISVKFSYGGDFWTYFWVIVWLLTVFWMVDMVFFKGRMFLPVKTKATKHIKKRMGTWWEKDDEY